MLNQLRERLPQYTVIPITMGQVEDALELMRENTWYYEHVQEHEVTTEECVADLTALPPNCCLEQKTYVGIYEEDRCLALIDFIDGYPEKKTGYLGLLMLSPKERHKGFGSRLFTVIKESAIEKGFGRIELACYETNTVGYEFWSRMGFVPIKKTIRVNDQKEYVLISLGQEIAR